MVEILTTALTETAGLLAGGFKKFFNIATPAATMDHGILVDTVTTISSAPTIQNVVDGVWNELKAAHATAGSFGANLDVVVSTRAAASVIGTPAGASVSADIAAVKAETASIQSDTNDIQTRLPAALIGGRMNSDMEAINNTVVNGDGSGTPWGP